VFRTSIKTICLLIAVGFLVSSVAYAIIYETKTLTVTQTIVRKWLSGWDKRAAITIDRSDITSNLTAFPVLLHLSSSSGIYGDNVSFVFNEVGSNSKKIAVTTNDGVTQCYVEIEKWIYPLSATTETLQPNAAGDGTLIANVFGATTHWEAINESIANDNTNYVYTSSSSYQRDLYNLPNHSGLGTINSVTVYFRFETSNSFDTAYAKAAIKTHGTVYSGTEQSEGSGVYVTRSYTWTNNPYTGASWSWTEIDDLQAGLELKHTGFYGGVSRCTQVYVEVDNTPPGGEAWLWVKVPMVSSVENSRLYFFYDKDHVDNAVYVGDKGSTPARNVWDANYKGVWHLTEDPSGTAPQMKDSTSNVNNGTSAGSMTGSDQVTAEIDGGIDFDGTNDEVNCANGASLQITTALTIEAWAKTGTTGTTTGIVNKQSSVSPYNGYQLRKYLDNKYRFGIGDPASYYAASDVAYTDSNWHYIVGVKSTTNYLFMDGVQQASTFVRSIAESGSNFDIGRAYYGYNDFWWNGQIDEVRVSNVARSSAWIRASYEGGRDHLIDFGVEENF
jgi:hypothetical protein